LLIGYMNPKDYIMELMGYSERTHNIYGANLMEAVENYTRRAGRIASKENYDIIHAHEWMTFQAGIAAKKQSGKPLVLHVHATEFDRVGDNVNQSIHRIEKEGMEVADSIITVSNYTKDLIVKHYGISPEKINVIHNATDFENIILKEKYGIQKDSRIVLFLGRITFQKGPEYFLHAAKKILETEKDSNIRFIMAGSGDMKSYIVEKAAEMGIADKFLFTGFISDEDVKKIYKIADVYVMPSVSEPFGITALEAIKSGVPVIVSKNSGVTELVRHCLKADFWDVNEMSDKILALLKHDILHSHLKEMGMEEVNKISWDASADKCIGIYNSLVGL